jgi:hypothetical protein
MIEHIFKNSVFLLTSSFKMWGNLTDKTRAKSKTKNDCVPVRTLTKATGASENANDEESSATIARV